jgi:hypothetical protein
MDLKGVSRIESERIEIKINPTCLGVERIEINDDDDNVGKIFGRFAIANQRGVIGIVEAQIAITLQRRILFADPIDPSYKILQTPS